MTDYFRVQGRTLLANGYLVLPIRPNEKRPAITSWQKARLSAADLASYPSHGVGIICGQGAYPVVGVDIDISHPSIGPALLEWCRRWLPGPAPERVGRAPRTLLVFRAAEAGWTKGSSTSFLHASDGDREQRVEVLGFGQQFVAYHVHPDTQQPYEWTDWLGGLESVKAASLPLLTETHLGDLMAEVDRLVRGAADVTVKSVGEASRVVGATTADWLAGLVPPVGVGLAEVVALLTFYKNDDVDYETWLRVGMALHHEYHGSEEAFGAWANWSAASRKHEAASLRAKWPSFGRVSGRAPTTLRWLLKVANQAKRDAEVVAVREAIDAVKATIGKATDAVQMTGPLAKQLRVAVPDDPAARAEIYAAFQAKFRELAGVSLPIAEVKKLLGAAKMATVRARRPLTEFGNSERMLDKYGSGLMFVPEIEQWYVWTGVYWRKAPDVEIHHYAKETIRALINEADEHDGAPEFFEFCAISQQARMVKNMVTLAGSDPRVTVPVGQLDARWWLLGVGNGIVDLRTGTLQPADPDCRITTICACDYVAGARAPLFVQTLVDVFGGESAMLHFFHRLIGYCLLGNPTEDVMVIPYGLGGNGKSTVLGTIRRAFGGYAKAASAETFTSAATGPGSGGGGAREDLVRLKGARFVYANEPEENSELRESAVKSMSGGDAIAARGLWAKSSIEIEPTWVVVMPTNHKPIIKGSDDGIWRRIVLLPFLRKFENKGEPGYMNGHDAGSGGRDAISTIVMPKDADRKEKLLLELPGVLAWCVEGAMRYQRDGLQAPTTVSSARDEYRAQMDLLSEWIDECMELDPHARESCSRLWISWEAWAKRNGCLQYVRSSLALGRRMENRFPSIKGTSGTRFRIGLKVKVELLPFTEVQING